MAGVHGYQVTGAAAVIRKDGNERYVARGAVFPATALDKANAEHLIGVGLIEPVELPELEPERSSADDSSADDSSAAAAAPPKRAARRSRKTATSKEPPATDTDANAADPDTDAGSDDSGDGGENA